MGANQNTLLLSGISEVASADWTRLLIGCRPEQYAASVVARAVEDCDAHLLNLNVAPPRYEYLPTDSEDADATPLKCEIIVNIRNGESVRRSLERYGFTVLAMNSSDDEANDMTSQNYQNLMRYLNI